MNDKGVNKSFVQIVKDLRSIFDTIDKDRFKPSDLNASLVEAWDEWWPDWVDTQLGRYQKWILSGIADMKAQWNSMPSTSKLKPIVLANLDTLERYYYAIVKFDSKIFSSSQSIGGQT